MALFGTARDVALFRSLGRELINDIISSEVDIFKISLLNTQNNIYGESSEIYFQNPVRLACQIAHDDQETDYSEMLPDRKQTIKFSFLRDELINKTIYLEIGDIISWNDIYWEIDHIINNKLYMNRDPQTNKTISDYYGWNVSIQCMGHMSQRNKINLELVRGSDNNENKIITEKYDLYQ